ncbi:hypothetical protein ACJIZ3_012768 [Penstemon smallii]|uniref:F-box protein n=1 Tax=Penstemon smallii TaxID=265156 RepID=A0ABD3UPJ6_9LAMI
MATLNSSSLIMNSSVSFSHKRGIVKYSLNFPNRVANISLPGLRTGGFVKELDFQKSPDQKQLSPITIRTKPDPLVMAKLYAILEAVADRIEMHKNIGDQRTNWNSLLLTSINALTLTAATMTGIAAITHGAPAEALKLSSTSMYLAVTGMLTIMNKIQPSQLAEEQRNAARLFKQLRNQIQTLLSIGNPTSFDVKEMMEKVLALDKAYPLPLLGGVMIEKFPKKVEPAMWWPEHRRKQVKGQKGNFNGWNRKLEEELRGIVNVMRVKDKEDYLKMGEKAMKLNKILAVSAPVLTGVAAVGSALVGSCEGAVVVGVLGGALASVVNALEHGGQVGMVFEMYRSNAGFFEMMEETIGENLREEELERRENGEVFEMKVGLQLGRSLSQLRDLAAATSVKGEDIDEFASKLF